MGKRKYQLWGFNFLTTNVDRNTNIITNNNQESEHEVIVPCFDGFSFFQLNGKYYVSKYPKFNKLNQSNKDKIKDYCGYYPNAGEYGVIMGALGITIECDVLTYLSYCQHVSNLKQYELHEMVDSWTK